MQVDYFANIVARSSYGCCNIWLDMVWLVNDNNVHMVGHMGGNTTYATPLPMVMDFGAQPIMIGKWLAQNLGFGATNLEPSCFYNCHFDKGHKACHYWNWIFAFGQGNFIYICLYSMQ